MRQHALPRLSDLLFISIFAGCMIIGSRMLNTDGDLGRHLTLGTFILDSRSIPAQDILSFTRAGDARPPYEWLSQVCFAIANRLLGLDGVVLLTSFVIALSFLTVCLDALTRSRTPLLVLLISGWAAIASSLHWLTRPHVFSFLFFALWVAGLERLRTKRSLPLWLFPALMVVWANAHGGFVLGILAWVAYAAGWLLQGRRQASAAVEGRQLLLVGATSLLASVITPDSWHNWQAVLQNRSAYVLGRTAETMIPAFSLPATWPFLGILALCLIGTASNFRRLILAHVLLLFGLAALSLAMARNIPFFAIAAAPVIAGWGDRVVRVRSNWARLETAIWKIDASLRGAVWPAAIVLVTVGWLSYQSVRLHVQAYEFSPDAFPVRAVDWLEKHPLRGNMFNDFNWGGYLLYRLWPNQRVFIDSQSDFYGEGLIRQYDQLTTASGDWQAIFDYYDIQWIIIPPSSVLAERLQGDDAWTPSFADSTAEIFARMTGP